MKKGFTLIELLAVIIILAIVALIATPIVLDVVNDAKKSAYKSSAYGIMNAAKLYYTESMMDTDKQTKLNGSTNLLDEFVINGEKPDSGYVYVDEYGKIAMAIVYNKTCYIKDFRDSTLIESEDYENCNTSYMDSILNGADPEIIDGMIPVIIASDGSLTKADTRLEWYNYSEKEWANVVLVSESSRDTYVNAKAGVEVKTSDVLAYYVWVPRYKYEIFTNKEDIVTNQDNSLNTAKLINVVFEEAETPKSTGTEAGEWLTHPAFTFGNDELNGIWVGKFETTGGSTNPTVLPNVTSLRNQIVSAQFQTALLFANNTLNADGSITHATNNKYGINDADAHMMKNSEWGAVAYLTASVYGQGTTEVRINNSSLYITGCAATAPATTLIGGEYVEQTDGSEGYFSGCENAYNTEIGVLASTTGNITGIYDMSGGAWEYVMGVVEDAEGSGVPASGRNNDSNSGFTGNFTCVKCDNSDETVTSITGVTFPTDTKYYDLYSYGTNIVDVAAYNRGQIGDATYEFGSFTNRVSTGNNITYYQSNWNNDYAFFVFHGYPWFIRGGNYTLGASAGVFAFYGHEGRFGSFLSFRSVLAI